MKDTSINIAKAGIRIQRYSALSEPEATSHVRVYRSSPERIALQIRHERSFAHAELPAAAVDQLIAALQAGRGEI
jgi:hypothetical protein